MATATEEHTRKLDSKFWITAFRAFLAVVLGTALLFQPDKARPLLVSFMGGFWLVGGLASLRWAANGDRARRWSVIAGIIGVGAGLLAIMRTFLSGYIPELVIAYLLGGVMILTGIMHIAAGSSDSEGPIRRSWVSVLLGIIETVMGIMIFISPLSYGPVVYWFITLWAFLGGVILFREAWRHRQQVKETAKATAESEAASEEESPANEM
jgi:uncharacterized membrane protein HdeD (DUF308 family)